jgi:hypothetical protein
MENQNLLLPLDLQFFASTYDANDIINGLYGTVHDENGQQLQSTQEFEANIEFNKEEKTIPGQFMKAHKVTNGTGTGSVTLDHIDTKLQKKIAENPFGKYNYIGALKDPTAQGEEAVLLVGVSFDGTKLIGFNVEELGSIELDFTYDSFRFLKTIE